LGKSYSWFSTTTQSGNPSIVSLLQLELRNLPNTTLGILIWELKPQLLASVPSNVRQKKGFRGRGVWLTVFIDDSYSKHMHDTDKTWMETRMGGTCTKDMHKIGEGWRELGINFRPEDSLYPPEFSSDSVTISDKGHSRMMLAITLSSIDKASTQSQSSWTTVCSMQEAHSVTSYP